MKSVLIYVGIKCDMGMVVRTMVDSLISVKGFGLEESRESK
jgi:hypothetical protein